MSNQRSADEIASHRRTKWLILLILFVLLVLLLLLPRACRPAGTTIVPTPTSATVSYQSPVIDAPVGALQPGTTEISGVGSPNTKLKLMLDGKEVGIANIGADGKWTSNIDLPAAGTYQIAADALDASGNVVASSKQVPLLVADFAPPTFDQPAGGFVIGDVPLTGTGMPNSKVQILLNGDVVDTVAVDANGKWQSSKLNLPKAGDYILGLAAVNDAGEIAATAPDYAFVVSDDTGTAPTFKAESSADGSVLLSGTGTPNSKVQVLVDGKPVGTADVDKDGKWSFNTAVLPDGKHSVNAVALDAAGKAGAAGTPFDLDVKAATAGTAPTFKAESSADGSVLLSGTGVPNSKVQVLVDGKPVGTADVDKDGKWSFNTAVLPDGKHSVNAVALDAAGKAGAAGTPFDLDVKAATAGTAPTFKAESSADGSVLLSGTGTPNSKVQVLVDGKPVGTADVDKDGKWSFNTAALSFGKHSVNAAALDAAGEAGAASSTPVELDVQAPVALFVEMNEPVTDAAGKTSLSGKASPNSTVEIMVDGKVVQTITADKDGNWATELALEPGKPYEVSANVLDANKKVVSSSKPVLVDLAGKGGVDVTPVAAAPTFKAESSADGSVLLSGTGTPNSKVQVLVDGKPVGTADVDKDGKWSFNTAALSAGKHSINAAALDAAGKAGAAGTPFTLDVPAPTAPTFTADVQEDGRKVTLSGTGTPNSKIQVLVDGKPVGTADVDKDGKWSLPLTLEPGDHNITVNALDANDKPVAKSEPTLVTAKFPTPTFAADVQEDGRKVVLTGKALPNSKVRVSVNGKPVKTVTADADGNWTYPLDFEPGDYTITADALDNAGKAVASGEPVNLTAKAAPVTTPTFNAEPDSSGHKVKLTGKADPGARVQIVIDGKPVNTVVADSDGNWTYNANLLRGEHEILANVLDKKGKVSATSTPYKVTTEGYAGGGCGRGVDLGPVWSVDHCDTLNLISRDTGISVDALIAANPTITNPNLIYPGQEVVLPGRPGAPVP
jgi:hypothetical protein